FDLAVNGGGQVALGFAKSGYLPARRAAEVAWSTYTTIDDVILLQPDSAATVVTFGPGAAAQVARGSVVEDADGPRQATLVFAPGTEAVLRMPDGTTRPAPSLTVRATEFTVGETGRRSMPAPLPATSAFTYAVELSADEALGTGATVELTRAPVLYVENFLGFPVGSPVPVGMLDRASGAWVPSDNGQVIRVLDVAGGVARVDANGDGQPDSEAQLAALQLGETERRQLAALYTPGAQLWRAPIATRVLQVADLNWPFQLLGADPQGSADVECRPRAPGAVDLCGMQVAGASAAVAGTPYSLHYRSDRSPSHQPGRTLDIALTGATVDPDLRAVELRVSVAGQHFARTFQPAPNLRFAFTWDGKDAFGRAVQGSQPVEVRIGHTFPLVYRMPVATARSFGMACGEGAGLQEYRFCEIPSDVQAPFRRLDTRWQTLHTQLGTFDPRADGMGGFTLSARHTYDPQGRVLHTGDGRRRGADMGTSVSPMLAGGASHGLAMGPDGSAYYVSGFHVMRRDPAGRVSVVAGSSPAGSNCGSFNSPCGDGGPAVGAHLVPPWFPGALQYVAVGADGSVFFAAGTRVRRVSPSGMLSTVLGSGVHGESADGTRSLEVSLTGVNGLAAGADGSIYILTSNGSSDVVRRASPDGRITTVAGGGGDLRNGPIPARTALIQGGADLKLGPDGSLYIAEGYRISRVTPDGLLTRIYGCSE
ncbi:MAG TPA: hypothetical protein VK420_02950, partial [Longimicrobium sp.]|nr:hypothetical protein [Longimicrobium sp.]